MAIPWLTVLQAIPWGQVIENTPKLVDTAQKLLSRLKKSKAPDDAALTPFPDVDETSPLGQLERLVQENRREVQALRQDLRDTADLLQHMTEQNVKMVSEIETLRRRTRRLQGFAAFMALLLIVAVVRALTV